MENRNYLPMSPPLFKESGFSIQNADTSAPATGTSTQMTNQTLGISSFPDPINSIGVYYGTGVDINIFTQSHGSSDPWTPLDVGQQGQAFQDPASGFRLRLDRLATPFEPATHGRPEANGPTYASSVGSWRLDEQSSPGILAYPTCTRSGAGRPAELPYATSLATPSTAAARGPTFGPVPPPAPSKEHTSGKASVKKDTSCWQCRIKHEGVSTMCPVEAIIVANLMLHPSVTQTQLADDALKL